MSNYDFQSIPEGKDPYLWRKAQARASFKVHATFYVLVNLILVAVWYFTSRDSRYVYFWPIWPILGWGIGLSSHGFAAYGKGRESAVEREYRKLKGE